MAEKKERMSEAAWNKMVDEHIAELNKRKGATIIPPPTHVLIESEYQQSQNHKFVTEDLIRNFAYAVGDPNPLWRDPSYARSTRWGGIIAPPVFDCCIASSDGAGNAPGGSFLLPGFNLFAGGNRHEYFGVIRPGDEFRIVDKYLGVEEKEVKGKSYRLFLESGQRSYINQRDEVVVIATGRRITTGTPPGKMDTTRDELYPNIKRHHFSQEELEVIHRAYDDELAGKYRQGKEVRYWEDVAVGDELRPVVKGPFDVSDACSAMLVEYGGAFAIKWNIMRGSLDSYPIDPQTGEHRFRRDWHFEDALAQISGVPYAFQIGKYSEMILAHVVTNWMGDDGFVKVLDFQIRRINIIGDMNWLKGKVTQKYQGEGEHLVDLDIWAENQDGKVVTRGLATVRLISRAD